MNPIGPQAIAEAVHVTKQVVHPRAFLVAFHLAYMVGPEDSQVVDHNQGEND